MGSARRAAYRLFGQHLVYFEIRPSRCSGCGPSDGTRRASRPDYPRNREFRRTCITECLCNGSSARDERVGIVPAKDGDKCIAQGER